MSVEGSMSLAGKRAVVTGAAQGIGLAIAERFQEAGADVVSVDMKPSSAGTSIEWDLSDIDSLRALVGKIHGEHGHFQVLVNCAGTTPTERLVDSTFGTWDKLFRLNTFAPFFLIQEMAKRWTGGSGSVINLASISSFTPKIEQTAYGATKAAIVSITRSAAAVLGPEGIRVNAMAPGVIRTPLTERIAAERAAIRGVTPEETLAPVVNATPLRRIGEPEEVAELALFLASDASSFITGQTFGIDGGSLMR